MSQNQITLESLFATIKSRLDEKDENSYSYELVKGGVEKIARKVGEEALEVVIAGFINEKNSSEKTKEELVGEICDLFYHSLVLMASQNIEFEDILKELDKRNNNKK